MDLRKGLDLSLGQKISGWAIIDRRLIPPLQDSQ